MVQVKIEDSNGWLSFVRKQLIDVAAATQTPAAHEALMQLITFTDESAIDYPERFILASAYTTHPGEYLLKGMLVRFTNHSNFFLLFCLILYLIFWFFL